MNSKKKKKQQLPIHNQISQRETTTIEDFKT
jgi:hypothetical protein